MRTFLAFVAILALVLTLQVGVGVAIYHMLPSWESRGQFGDLFGAANATFSGLAFGGLIYTILLQRTELQLQREELRMTRTELARSAQAQEKSERALVSQAFAAQVAAELSAINHLLAHVHSEIKRLTVDSTGEIVYRAELERLRTQRSNLLKNLNTLYSESVAARIGS